MTGIATQAKKESSGLKNISLRAAGLGTFIADAALIMHGISAGKRENILAGIFGLTAGTVGMRYGNAKSEKLLEVTYRDLNDYLKKEGVEIPNDPTTESLAKEGGIIDNVESFLYKNPSQVMNVLYGLIGTQFFSRGHKDGIKPLMASGVSLMAGGLGGILINEKKPDPEHPPQGLVAKAWSKIEAKPLRLTGAMFNINQIGLAMDAFGEYKRNPESKNYVFKIIAVAGFVFGNIMMMISSKSHGSGEGGLNEESMQALAKTSALVIASQPKEVQEGLLDHVAGFLASKPTIDMKAEEISAMLKTKLAELARPVQETASWLDREGARSSGEQQQTR